MLSTLLRESSSRIKPELSSFWKQYQHQRCEFSQKTRRRKPKNLSSSKPTLTTKDRLRVPTTSTITTKPSAYNTNAVDADLISERLSTRLQWARSNLRKSWYDVTGSSPQNPRPARASLEMDANWWFWNLLLAISPAVIIAFYCEMVAKPQMVEFYSEQEEQQSQQQQLGDVSGTNVKDSSSSSLWNSQLYSLIIKYILGQVSEETKNAVAQVPTDLPSDVKIPLENERSSPPASSSPAQIQLMQQVKELQQRLKEMEQEIDTSKAMMTTVTPISQSNIRTRIQERQTAVARSQPQQSQKDDISSKKNSDVSTTVTLYLEHAQRLVQDWASAAKPAARHQEEAAKIQPKKESSQDQSRLLTKQHQSSSNGSILPIHADDVEISPTNGGTEKSASGVPCPSSPSNSRTDQSSTKRQHWWTWRSGGRNDGRHGE